MRPALVPILFLVVACSARDHARPRDAAPPHDAVACAPPSRVEPTAGRFDCAADADCVNSCSWGAIHRAAAARLDDG